MSGQANQLVSLSSSLTSSSSPSSAKLRQPMCAGCEKALPNQIVFDKIESIIRMMQDEQNGLPVKTAKSFMSKIPSVFTGIDLIQWMMRNLKLEDQQEAIHLANLIASHGYIFPIEDHTLSIKNDCTFYRFQTPCLWPSNNTDPENTDYAVYLCKRTMQGKTRLELADYEAENLARLQKMFSRKWEFIFMQAESQAKVDKKRDKLERKVLDSQERAFWDVYRPVPGCVNTTELDIKKACRLSKSAKRCNECQKVASSASTSASSAVAAVPAATAAGAAASVSASAAASTGQPASASSPSPAPSSQPQQQQLTEPLSSEPQPQQHQHHHHHHHHQQQQQPQPTRPVSKIADRPAAAAEEPPEASKGEKDKLPQQQQQEPPAPEEVPGQTMTRDSAGCSGDNKQASGGGGGVTSSSGREEVEQKEKSATKQQQQPKQVKHHHHHAHQHHAHHHHHHHHPHGPHGHHHHHHHHRQCAHHKQPTGTAAVTGAAAAAAATTTTAAGSATAPTAAREPQLSIPAESILTATVAAATAGWAGAKSMDVVEQQQQQQQQPPPPPPPAAASLISKDEQSAERKPSSTSSMRSRERRAPGEQFMRTPSVQVAGCRRKSECNRMHSMAGIPSETGASGGLDEASLATSAPPLQQKLSPADERPASACCSFTSLDREQLAAGEQPAAALRKSSLIGGARNVAAAGQSQASEAAASGTITRKGSVQTGQRSPLVSTRSVCATSSGSTISVRDPQMVQLQLLEATAGDCSSASPAAAAVAHHQHRHNIGELERELEALKVRLDRRIGGVKMSKVTQSYLSYFKQWAEYDPFIAQPIPSNPWISDSTELWDSERQTKDVHSRRVRRWAFSLKELLNDPAGREQFHRFLEKEFSAENLKFWDAVQELKRVHSKDVSRRVEAIWQEYLAQDANCPINIDSKSYETSKKNMAKNKNNRYIFDEAAGHVYQLMKNDSYPRYLRSEMYKDYKEASEKKRTNQVAFDVFKPQITTLKHKFNF